MRWFPVRVSGASMTPTLQPGDFLAVRPLRPDEPKAGQLIVLRSGDSEIVKRVVDRPDLSRGEYWVEGDNKDGSTDSRSNGPVKRDQIEGLVRARYKPITRFRIFR